MTVLVRTAGALALFAGLSISVANAQTTSPGSGTNIPPGVSGSAGVDVKIPPTNVQGVTGSQPSSSFYPGAYNPNGTTSYYPGSAPMYANGATNGNQSCCGNTGSYASSSNTCCDSGRRHRRHRCR